MIEDEGSRRYMVAQEFKCSVCEEMVSEIYRSVDPSVCIYCAEEENDE